MAHLPKIMFFFWKNHLTNFHVTLNPFHYAIFQKKSIEWIQSYDKMPFSGQNKPFAPNEIFFRKTINISFMYLLVLFIEQNFKKILRVNPELRECSTFGPKMAQLPKMNFFFFRKTVNIINFHVPLDPIHFAKFQKNPYSGSKVMSARHF